MRVLDLNTLYIDGGAGGVNTYLREKARCFSSARSPSTGERIEHTIVVPGARHERLQVEASMLITVKSPRIPWNAQHRLLVDFGRVAALIDETRPDVIEVDTSYFLGHVAARALGSRRVPIVGFYHVHLPMLYVRPTANWIRTRFTSRTEPLAWQYARLCARPCDRIIVATRDLWGRLEKHRLGKLELLPLGVNLQLFRPRDTAERLSLPGVDPARPVLLYVGRLSREKDLDVLFAAHAELEQELGAQLLIVGDGPSRTSVRRAARRSSRVFWLGACPYGERLAALYRAADVLALPSRHETFGLTVLEAFASGLPVVAVRQGGPSELCRSELGALARPGDARDFAMKLREVLAGPRHPAAARRHVEESYSWEATFERLLALYGELAAQELPARRSHPARA
jgi:alpha-1,6-mannosyltransferase